MSRIYANSAPPSSPSATPESTAMLGLHGITGKNISVDLISAIITNFYGGEKQTTTSRSAERLSCTTDAAAAEALFGLLTFFCDGTPAATTAYGQCGYADSAADNSNSFLQQVRWY